MTTARRDRGAILPLTGIALSVLVLMTSFAVDLGRVQLERRDLQAVADAVALDMVRQLEHHADAAVWGAALTASRDRNDFGASGSESDGIRDLVATPGCYDRATDAFVAGCVTPDAVQVVATDTVDYFFQPGKKTTSREAIAEQEETAEFKVGSFVAGIDPATNSIVGQLLNAVAPGATAVSYAGLADAEITLTELAAHLPVTAGSPEELLETDVTVADILVASADALSAKGNAADASVLYGLIGLVVDHTEFRFGDLIGVAAGQSMPAGEVVLEVPQLLTTGVFLVDGDHFVTVPGTTLNIPFVGDVGVRLTGVEGPRIGGTQDGASVTTRQVALEITPVINISTDQTINVCTLPSTEQGLLQSLVGGLLNLLTCILSPLNRVFTIEVAGSPTVRATAGQMTVTQDIDCGARTLTLTPSPVALSLDAPIELTATGTLLGASLGNLLRVNLAATAATYGTASPVVFSATDAGPYHQVFSPTTARVGSTPLGLAGLLNVSAAEITVLNASLTTLSNLLLPLLQTTLNAILGQLDTLLLQPLAQLLGVQLGGADLTPLWMRCGNGGPILAR